MKLGTGLILLATFANGLSFPTIAASAEDTDAPKIDTGNKWVYQETDNITKTPTTTLTWVVTEINNKNYAMSVTSGTGNSIVDVFDFDGNALQFGQNKYIPFGGYAPPSTAKSGTTWKRSFTWKDVDKGIGGKAESVGNCQGSEQVEVPAGTFDGFKCTVTTKFHAAGGGPVIWEDEITSWNSPQTIRPVKLIIIQRARGHVSSNKTQELSDYQLD